ncbi:DNA phosphorothioation system sulfurtransferase DndC [Aliarcobacter butzleri]|uniref:DNA phosphorothioation system sulfurtransferase DndC n=1 Tax=Aliarcobacter butzleri TaxID=28197 RepID=A0AAW7PRI1_9BACT|nr:DNA phosphorothioation system sulfurtransferase DndC [Aliarcobacter butzleri]MDN5063927.1 DNA phosphorothioation system sulfurtransferase DndC [Aliarcobacter butzleri]MDN5065161.1 DNA phosphorothioation system sulfurtransferase DndC [Aliarcobacter butzleri]
MMIKAKETIKYLKQQYFEDNRPWVVTYSGGKDSTTVLHLVITMLQELHKENKATKHVYVVSSDTTVEMPIIEKYTNVRLDQITNFANTTDLPISCHKLEPKVEESFWTLLLGLGYPSPTNSFRWCTERMKINPATEFLKSLVNKHQSILMLLGVRTDESISRATSIESRVLNHRGLSVHDGIPNAYVLSPIKYWSNEDVWTYLSKNPFPWGDHSYMMSLYDKGSGEGDCNIALNPDSPSCGKTRFGCWVCTVVEKDRSMEGMLKNGEEWMEPLWHFREMLYKYRNDSEKRDSRRRDGSRALGPFLMTTRKELLKELLVTEKKVNENYHIIKKNASDYNSNEKVTLIKDDEIELIQKKWNKDGDISNTAFRIAQEFNRMMNQSIQTELRKDLESIENDDFNIDLFERIFEVETYRKNISNRYSILNEIESKVLDFYKGEYREIN